MAKNLVIVESPAKAKTITKYLGSKFSVMASVGHIIDLPKADLGVDIENDFKPTYVVIKGKTKVLNKIKSEAKKADVVYLACDPDREGEAIAWHIAEAIKKSCKKNPPEIKRALFHEITKSAIKLAVDNPQELRRELFESQQARRILDRLVGYKISPILWNKVRRGLSAGRVQSIAVRIVCEREDSIEAFKQEEYWSIVTHLEGSIPPKFEAKLIKCDDAEIKIHNQQQAEKIVNELESNDFVLQAVRKKARKRNPYPPFITSNLQQEASRKLGYTAKKTMAMAQMLYEGVDLGDGERVGLITYMRTDSPRTAPQAITAVREYITKQYGKDYLPEKPRMFKAKKSAQEAHEAIRPTAMDRPPDEMANYLERDALRLYDLIWKRFVASQMIHAVYDQTSFDILAKKYLLRATGSVIRHPGFIAVYMEDEDEEKEKNEEENPTLPDLKEGENLKLISIDPNQHFTQPPPRFTEASLVKELEEKGIGRPSTYAAIMSTIQDKNYVEKIEKRFHPTHLGRTVNGLLVENFPRVMNVDFTAKMENELDEVEEGTLSWLKVLNGFYVTFAETLEKAQAQMKNMKKQEIKTGLKCPDCKDGDLIVKWGRRGEFLACSNYPECRHTSEFTKDKEGNIIPQPKVQIYIDEECPNCKSKLVMKHGKFGEFLACPNYPTCKFTKAMTIGIKCPLCNEGDVVQRRTKRGRNFFGCGAYPKCKFASWDKPVLEKCETCGNSYKVQRVRKTGTDIVCPECTKKEKENQ